MASYQVQEKPPIQWSTIDKTPINLEKLQLLTLSPKALAGDGYNLSILTEQQIWAKMRCQNCGQKILRYRPPIHNDSFYSEQDFMDLNNTSGTEGYASREQQEYLCEVNRAAESAFTPRQTCFFHDGKTFKGEWQCCGGRFNTKGCCSNIDHVAGDIDELRHDWSFHKTPPPTSTSEAKASVPGLNPVIRGTGQRGGGRGRYVNSYSSYQHVQPAQNQKSIRPIVALDCEMGTSRIGATVLIRVSMVDFFTQEVLIDSLVSPTVEMAHYNTRYSGVTFAAMRNAIRANTAIRGTDTARNEVFKYVDSNTIVIVHGGSNDFTTLRWLHPASRIIDTCVLETWDHEVREQGWKRGLKDACQRRCGIMVQNAKLGDGRAAGHDSLEDALATREIVCWWLRMIPDQ